MNPVIKFSTLFGVLAVELAGELERSTSITARRAVWAGGMFFFIWRSFTACGLAGTTDAPLPARSRSKAASRGCHGNEAA
jgi:K(+)-stimulated pyrophosphate-energized sodium pump